MTTSTAIFDSRIEHWLEEQRMPWQQLIYKMTQANLDKHLDGRRGRLLDAGGGSGSESIPLAKDGYHVDIVDVSREMLAEAVRQATLTSVQEQVAVHLADIRDIQRLFPASSFDLILCHNVLQYTEDAPAVLKGLADSLKPSGLLSVVCMNRFSLAYRAALPHGSLADALAQLDAPTTHGMLFDTTLLTYSADEVGNMLKSAGCRVEKDYGIRCICDYWGDNESKLDPEIFEQLERLEFALTDRYPYKLVARYFQVIARKA